MYRANVNIRRVPDPWDPIASESHTGKGLALLYSICKQVTASNSDVIQITGVEPRQQPYVSVGHELLSPSWLPHPR